MFPHGPIPLLALVCWPIFTFFLFRRYRLSVAAGLSTIAANAFLPDGDAAFDLPLIPPMDKENIATVSVAILVFLMHSDRLRQVRAFRGVDLIPILTLLGLFGTWQTNKESLVYGFLAGQVEGARMITLPGMVGKDVFTSFMRDFLAIVLPFVMGRVIYRSREDLRAILNCFVAIAVLYVPFILFELRLSPILHSTVYGYNAFFDFRQVVRWGGWRPQVFFYHGLYLSKFMLICSICALGLYIGKEKKSAWRFDPKWTYVGLACMTVLTKSSGCILHLIFFGFLFFRTSMGRQARVMTILASLVIFYPYGRVGGLIPTEEIIEEIRKRAPERAHSLNYRFKNENELSARAGEKIWFGWGGYERGHIWDKELGRNLSVTDGYWIIRFNEQGAFGVAGPFLIMLLPVFLALRRFKRIPWKKDRQMLLTLAAVSLIYAIECLPNAIATSLPFFASGALWGLASNLSDPKYIKKVKRKERLRRGPPPPPGWGPPGYYPPGAPSPWPAPPGPPQG